jgi:glucosamine-6-phosphate deaminase
LLENWEKKKAWKSVRNMLLKDSKKPVLKDLQFVQIDEFYPIASQQNNSFFHYVNKFYIDGFGLDPDKALLINSDEITLHGAKSYKEIFP